MFPRLMLGCAASICAVSIGAQQPGKATADASGAPGAGATIEVVVADLRNAAGSLGCQLFAGADGFPADRARAVQAMLAPIAGGKALCRFAPVPAGSYAVAIVHDENGNAELDRNFFGVPTEGYGVSNNRTYALREPRWDESRFELSAGEVRRLTITLRY